MENAISDIESLKNIAVVGPSMEGAKLEGSKDYAKSFLIRKTRLQQCLSDLSWKKVQMSLLDIMR